MEFIVVVLWYTEESTELLIDDTAEPVRNIQDFLYKAYTYTQLLFVDSM